MNGRWNLVRIRPREDSLFVSRGDIVLATDRDGFIQEESDHGLIAFETRMLSRYRYLIDGKPPLKSAQSNIEQHSWLGYYIAHGVISGERDGGSGMMVQESEQTIELRLSRVIGDALIEQVQLTNFTQQLSTFRLDIELAADFADVMEIRGNRKQEGVLATSWRQADDFVWELVFDYRAEHRYDRQGESGVAHVDRGLVVRVRGADSSPTYVDGRISFDVAMGPGESWRMRIEMQPRVESGFGVPQSGPPDVALGLRDAVQTHFLQTSSVVTSEEDESLTPVVMDAVERARRDLASLRLFRKMVVQTDGSCRQAFRSMSPFSDAIR